MHILEPVTRGIDGRAGSAASGDASSTAFAALASLPVAVVAADERDRVVYLNRCAEQVFGSTSAEVVGDPVERLLNTLPFCAGVRTWSAQLKGQWLRLYLVEPEPVDNREFLLDVAHELRTPAATIRTSSEVLVDALASSLSEDVRLLLHNLEHEAARLASLVDNLLDLHAMRTAGGRLARARCDLREVARGASMGILPLARRRAQTVTLSLPHAPVWACVVPDLLERAVLNLLSNAQKYGADGGQVSLRLEADAASVSFCVEDDGPGVPEHERERIFERLYRGADARARRIQGSGLGLAVCRAVVELHGGRVAVADGMLGGGCFTIELPR